MNETSKAVQRMLEERDPLYDWVRRSVPLEREQELSLDVGAGKDPFPGARVFDLDDGDAQHLDGIQDDSQQLVWSSHCLEHLENPVTALDTWWSKVRPGGILWVLVPDFALYEHGLWPSVMNPDHQWNFSCYGGSLNERHHTLDYLWRLLPGAKLLRLGLQARGYDFSRLLDPVDQTHGPAEASCELVVRKLR